MAISKKTKMTMDEGAMGYSCCMSGCGIVHFIGGLGVGFLLVEYFGLINLMTWGWVLVILAVIGHLTGKSRK